MINSIFQRKEPGQLFWSKFIFLLVLSLVLIFVNCRYSGFVNTKSWLSTLSVPFQWLADSPDRVKNFVENNFISRTALIEENRQLKATHLLLQQQIQQLSQMSDENEKLRTLLHASKKLKYTVEIAEVTNISPDPQIKQITLNKGLKDHTFIGQPVLDDSGIVGQVINTNYFYSTVLLITDSSSRIPVTISRTGHHAVAAGSYFNETLTLLNISDTVNIKEGDLLISSGLGGRFPQGYPVAEVTSVDRVPVHGFLNIQAEPLAKVSNNRLVLLAFPAEKKQALPSVGNKTNQPSKGS